jgi:plastocyanin
MRAILAVAAVFGLLLCGSSPGAAAAAAPKTYTITIDATRFEPETLTVKPGDIVIWVNKDLFPHTATSKAAPFDSHEIKPGKSWKLTTAKTGTFDYLCLLHQTMKGTLRVK